MTVADTTVTYDELVERGRAAREQADDVQWIEGDLALQVEALPGDQRPRDPATGDFIADELKALQRYAEDVGVAYRGVREYRRVAAAWPPVQRALHVPWAVHQALAAQEDRFNLIRDGMTVREAERIVGKRRAGSSSKPGWHELLGHVGDALVAAEKAMTKTETAIGDVEPSDKFREKAERYAEWAESLAQRLRAAA